MTTRSTNQSLPAEQPVPQSGTYEIDPAASAVRFRMRAMFGLVPVQGSFRIRRGRITVAEDVAASSVDATIGADTFESGNARRDEHVKSGDFLDAAAHPDLTFHSERVDVTARGGTLVGQLTVRGVSAPVDVTVDSVKVDGDQLAVQASANVDRYASGVTGGKGMTGRRMKITLDIRASR